MRSPRRPQIRTSLACAAAAAFSLLLLQAGPAWAQTSDHAARAHKNVPAFHADKTPLPSDISHSSGGAPSAPSVGSTSGMVVRTIIGLAIVLAVVYGLYWLLKSAARAKSGGSDDRIAVVATTTLAQGRALHLIRAGEELILVGATEHAVTPIRVYSAGEAAQMELVVATPDQLPRATESRSFATIGGALELIRQRTVRT